MADLRSINLASATDLDGFRRACRELWAAQVEPANVVWHNADESEGDLFLDVSPAPAAAPAVATAPLAVPARFMPLIESVVLQADPERFAFLYRLVWRLQREPGLRHDALDADVVRAQQMAQAVRRDMHKMKAFVRFRTVDEDARDGLLSPPTFSAQALDAFDADAGRDAERRLDAARARLTEQGDDGRLHVAWFEPEHHIVEATAPFFARRFANMRWAILTPERSALWDGRELLFAAGARRDQAPPADAGERLWLTYYESIFNPARLKLSMMKKEMPVRYWKNLPEAVLISGLAEQANERSMTMVAREPTSPRRPERAAAARTEPQPAPGFSETPGGAAPSSLPALREALERCRECPIGEHATQAVPGEGLRHARLMFVGEQPGDQEDLQGKPFVGPAGQLFSRALQQLAIRRDQAYVTNAVKHFKFELRGKRRIHKTPAQQEAAACLHWLESEIELVDPEALIALGATAARQLMGRAVAVTRERGQWLTRSDGRRVLVTLHPSALLRMEPEDKAAAYEAWLADLRQLTALLATPGRAR